MNHSIYIRAYAEERLNEYLAGGGDVNLSLICTNAIVAYLNTVAPETELRRGRRRGRKGPWRVNDEWMKQVLPLPRTEFIQKLKDAFSITENQALSKERQYRRHGLIEPQRIERGHHNQKMMVWVDEEVPVG